jgi:hypothetical protein
MLKTLAEAIYTFPVSCQIEISSFLKRGAAIRANAFWITVQFGIFAL